MREHRLEILNIPEYPFLRDVKLYEVDYRSCFWGSDKVDEVTPLNVHQVWRDLASVIELYFGVLNFSEVEIFHSQYLYDATFGK